MNILLSGLFVPHNLVSRDGFGSPVPHQPAHLHTQAESGAYSRDSSRVMCDTENIGGIPLFGLWYSYCTRKSQAGGWKSLIIDVHNLTLLIRMFSTCILLSSTWYARRAIVYGISKHLLLY